MSSPASRPADSYSPLYFLASLGAGGLTVTFFMYLMFWLPHPGRPVPIFEDVAAGLASGGTALRLAIVVALIGIAVMAFLNIKLLIWNIGALRRFQQSEAYAELRRTNGETTLLAAPLAAAMTVNVGFILGLVFVPGLWGIVEYLFPMALIAFLAIGIWALRLVGHFLGRVLSQGGVYDMTAHNSFAQLLPAFAIAMVGVGLSAPAAMSTNTVIVGASLVLSTFFGVTAIIYTLFAAITGLNSMLHHGTAEESAPTLMVVVPIVTVLGIMFMRQDHGLHVAFEVHSGAGETLIFLSRLITIELLFLALGLLVLKRQGYWRNFISGERASAGSYTLICPGVAFAVLMHFFVNKGLVAAGVIAKFGPAYWGLTAIAILAQFAMIALVLHLNRKHFTPRSTAPAGPLSAT
ncbi:hypothetical protein BXY70_3417 [Roseovarius halotolerans]|uniref:Voltage-dependent anion channel n=1 Tax=Roseovarius halotolerans TaxID=505353 RepID=A0A1X6ZPD2_9RHOB|nr:hypothetical protein [Roseovarius halotolerans]RKT28059.1 hypothetical protein BXY70_3417 [Roseovarius halotolerans]SLN57797.1 hypothetical protein ROH8110_03183 [Roseovarius halotolerans]